MSFWDALGVLRRRWKLSIPALFLAVEVGVAAFFFTPPSYAARADVLFLPSTKSPDSATPVNPYMSLGSTLGSTADVVTRVVTTPQVVKQLAGRGGTAPYAVLPDLSTSAPVLVVTARDRSKEVAARTTRLVVAEMQQTLRAQQEAAGAPRATWMSANVLVSEGPQRQWKGQVRLAIAAFGATSLLCLAVIFGLEGRRRRGVKAARRKHEVERVVASTEPDIRPGRDVAARPVPGPTPADKAKARKWA